jgi:hypothetical protein
LSVGGRIAYLSSKSFQSLNATQAARLKCELLEQ